VAVAPSGWSASKELTVCLFGCPNFMAEGSDVRTGGQSAQMEQTVRRPPSVWDILGGEPYIVTPR
jgi:hypothetical protein